MDTPTDTKRFKDKRENYAKIVSQHEAERIWIFLQEKFGINPEKYKYSFSFAQNKRGRLWLASNLAIEFLNKERFDPAKVLTCVIGKSDSRKLLQDNLMYIRLTIDGALFLSREITKNILYISEEEEQIWYTGEVINRTNETIQNDIYVLAKGKTKQIIGSTIAKNGYLLNFVPKWRRPDRLTQPSEVPLREPGN